VLTRLFVVRFVRHVLVVKCVVPGACECGSTAVVRKIDCVCVCACVLSNTPSAKVLPFFLLSNHPLSIVQCVTCIVELTRKLRMVGLQLLVCVACHAQFLLECSHSIAVFGSLALHVGGDGVSTTALHQAD
jgi:hypothetical protein